MAIAATPSALPVWRTVNEAYTSALTNWLAVLKMSWAWLLILWLVRLMLVPPVQDMTHLPVGRRSAMLMLYLAVFSAGAASIAVAWHRLFFLGEQPPAFYLRLGGQVPRYLARLLLIAAITCAIAFVMVLLAIVFLFLIPDGLFPLPSPRAHVLILFVFGLPVVILTTLVAARMAIGMPGFAIERPVSLGNTLHITRGNAWRLCFGAVLVSLPGYVCNTLAQFMVNESAPLIDFVDLVVACVPLLAFISVGYRFFFRTGLE